jgi:hypothetical protein
MYKKVKVKQHKRKLKNGRIIMVKSHTRNILDKKTFRDKFLSSLEALEPGFAPLEIYKEFKKGEY